MIVAVAYFFIFLFLIYKNGLFGVFKDNKISPIQFTFFFVAKCLAIPVFYWIYEVHYGGMENFDAGLFLKDSKVINNIAFDNPGEYLKILFGLQDETPGSYLYTHYLNHTNNWDEGASWRLFFNDNRTMIRIHSVIHFISFNNYFVHALFSCILGYIGIALIYKSLKHLFVSKELFLFGAFVFLPNLWLFSGALLKEPIVLCNMGLLFYLTDKLFKPAYGPVKKAFYTALALVIAYSLKVQVTLVVFTLYLLYKFIVALQLKRSGIYYVAALLLVIVISNGFFIVFKQVSMFTFINKKQTEFYDLMKGGLFLKDEHKFVRLPYDLGLIKEVSGKGQKNVTIKKGASYMYWEDASQRDTLFCGSNSDTVTQYTLVYSIVPANSGFTMEPIRSDLSLFRVGIKGIYSGLFRPIKFNNFINSIVSLENIVLLVCFLVSIYGLFVCKNKIPLLFFLSLVISLMLLFAVATPNTGAIIRYRSVVVPFLLLSAIYTLNKKHETGRVR